MSLKDRITEDMKTAMRAKDSERLGTIRMITAAIKQREVDERITLDDTQVLAVIEKMIKMRKESIAQFQSGGRDDLVAKEHKEIDLLQAYMPAQLSDAELDALIAEAIAESGATSIKDMGKAMALLKQKAQGRADMAAVSASSRRSSARLSHPWPCVAASRARAPDCPTLVRVSLMLRRALAALSFPRPGDRVRTHPATLHRRADRARRSRRADRQPRAAEKAGQGIQGLLPVPRREDALVHGRARQAVLSLLRLRRARHRARLPDGARSPELRRGGRGPGRARRRSTCRAKSRRGASGRADG